DATVKRQRLVARPAAVLSRLLGCCERHPVGLALDKLLNGIRRHEIGTITCWRRWLGGRGITWCGCRGRGCHRRCIGQGGGRRARGTHLYTDRRRRLRIQFLQQSGDALTVLVLDPIDY